MFPMTVTIHNQSQLSAILASMGGMPEAQAPSTSELVNDLEKRNQAKETAAAPVEKPRTSAATTAGAAPSPRTAKADAATAAPEKTAAESSPTAESAAAEPQASTAAPEPIPYAKVAAAITARVANERPKVIAVLAKYGAKKGTDLAADQYAAFLADLEA